MHRYTVYVSKIDKDDIRHIYANTARKAKSLAWEQIKGSSLGWINKRQFLEEARILEA